MTRVADVVNGCGIPTGYASGYTEAILRPCTSKVWLPGKRRQSGSSRANGIRAYGQVRPVGE
jgi:hypothetical protein